MSLNEQQRHAKVLGELKGKGQTLNIYLYIAQLFEKCYWPGSELFFTKIILHLKIRQMLRELS